MNTKLKSDDCSTAAADECNSDLGKTLNGDVIDPRPPLDDPAALSDWIHRRYIVTDRDNVFVERLKMVLQRDGDGQFLPSAKKYQEETMGICVTAPAREGKTFMVTRTLARIFGQKVDMKRCGNHILYCRLKTNETAKGVYMDICRATGLEVFPSRMTQSEAYVLATHRLKMAGVKIIIIDELHNLLGSKKEAANLFLKGFFHDDDGLCLIAIGTERLRQFIYDDPNNAELSGRFLDFPLLNVSETSTVVMINDALKKLTDDVEIKIGSSIKSDAYFANRIYDGCRGSFGRCMRLLTTSIVYALEDGAKAVEAEDFATVFNLQFLHFNPENPFMISNYKARISPSQDDINDGDILFDDGNVEPVKKKRPGKPRVKAEA
ncbi:MAG: ATP-binding protein [Rhodobacterales bacterium]